MIPAENHPPCSLCLFMSLCREVESNGVLCHMTMLLSHDCHMPMLLSHDCHMTMLLRC